MLKRILNRLTTPFDEAIVRPDDPDDVRLGKRIFVRLNLFLILVPMITIVQGILTSDQPAIIISILISFLFTINLVLLKRSGRFRLHFLILVLMNILIPFAWSANFGGFHSNYGNLWISFSPLLLVVLVLDRREIIAWFLVFSVLAILSGILDPFVANPANLSSTLHFDNVFGVLASATIIMLTINYYKREKNSALGLLALEQEKSENLLLNILPRQIAETLKVEEGIIADHYDHASILFADLVGFTQMSAQMEPVQMVSLLNEIFSHFDTLVEKYGAEKIRTIGDNYMVATGLPVTRKDHAQAIAGMALEIRDFIRQFSSRNGRRIDFRIGINSGPVVAGVIGQKKFQYDVWSDTVNIASRMESHGVPGKIQVTRDTYDLLVNEFILEPRGKVDVKGQGEMETWYLEGRKAQRTA